MLQRFALTLHVILHDVVRHPLRIRIVGLGEALLDLRTKPFIVFGRLVRSLQGLGAIGPRAHGCLIVRIPVLHVERTDSEPEAAEQGQRLARVAETARFAAAGLRENGFPAIACVDLYVEGAALCFERDTSDAAGVGGGPQLLKGQGVHGNLRCNLIVIRVHE